MAGQEIEAGISEEQRLVFLKSLDRGASVMAAAKCAKISLIQTPQLLDLLGETGVSSVINLVVHKEILSTGKQLAWKVAKELMTLKETPPATRWAAARWTLEAAGEGIGNARNAKKKDKDIHEMTEAELVRFVEKARGALDRFAIDVTPSAPDSEELSALLS